MQRDMRMSRRSALALAQLYTYTDRACLSVPDASIFFPGPGNASASAAKRVCGRCPHKYQCLIAGLGNDASLRSAHGVWGGKTARERERIAEREAAP